MIWLILLTLPTIWLVLTFQTALLHRERTAYLIAAALADVLANYGGLALLFYDWPKWGEWTFSKRLPRLCNLPGWRGKFARRIRIYINSKVPGHIP